MAMLIYEGLLGLLPCPRGTPLCYTAVSPKLPVSIQSGEYGLHAFYQLSSRYGEVE